MITVDDSRLPLIEVTFRGASTDEEFDAYLGRLTELVYANPGCLLLFDLLEAKSPTPLQRKLQSDWLSEVQEPLKACRGLAFAVSSPILRGVLSTLLWMSPLGRAHRVLRTRDEAEAWIQARFAKEGVSLPPRGPRVTL